MRHRTCGILSMCCWSLGVLLSVNCQRTVTVGDHKLDVLSKIQNITLASCASPYGFRSGSTSKDHSCSHVRHVPWSLRFYFFFKPSGIHPFYRKYTEAYGIPIIGSKDVPDEALQRACYVLRFLLADHSTIRQSFYKLYGRVAVLGVHENITDLPDYTFLTPDINHRARGLGPTQSVPVVSAAEENVLCYREDRYHGEDILLHELAHGVHMAVQSEVPAWQRYLEESYKTAIASGRWNNTYSSTSVEEYLAEGVQSFFGVNSYSNPPNGIHGQVDTPEKLLEYDSHLYHLIELLFPCRNVFLRPCQTNRTTEAEQQLKMDCNMSEQYELKLKALLSDTFTTNKSAPVQQSNTAACKDNHIHCQVWSKLGECQSNPVYMKRQCRASCRVCTDG